MPKKCIGIDASTGLAVAVSFDGLIQSVEPLVAAPEGLPLIAPGWIDIQVNGFVGVDYCSPSSSQEEIARSLEALFATGVTRLYPTVITGSPRNMADSLANLARAREALPYGAAMEGFHVEGPHITPEDGPRGAHPCTWVRPPDIDEYRRWQEAARGHVRLVTVAPEWPGAIAYIETLVREGVVVAVGHTNGTRKDIQAAASAGATLSTHLGNGAHLVMERHPNYIWEQLAEDRLAASFIADGIHLGPAFLKVALRAKGLERSVLITDAVRPAGCPPGRYRLGEVDVELHADNRVTLIGLPKLAGSTLRMDRGLENLIKLAGLSLVEAIAMATRNPARVGRIANRQRGLAAGERADLVEFRYDEAGARITIEKTWLEGELVYSAG